MAISPSEMTAEQRSAVRSAVLAEPSLAGAISVGDDQTVADWLNAPTTYRVRRTRVSKQELVSNTSDQGTTFNWTGAGFIGRSQGERDAWRELFDAQGEVNPSLPNVQQAFLDIFSGTTAPAPANRAHINYSTQRLATRLEALLASGAGTLAAPGLLVVEGEIDPGTVSNIVR